MRDVDSEDFASAAMMRLLASGLAQQGIAGAPLRGKGAHVPRADKREVLERVLASHGQTAVLSIADAAPAMAPEPVVRALTRARDTGDLLDRWQRLERFSHARHVVDVAREGHAHRLTHRARDGGPPPSRAESLLVFGVLTILTEMVSGASARLASPAGEIWREDGTWHAPGPAEPPLTVILSTAPPRRASPSLAADPEDPVTDLRRCVLNDPLHRWTVASLAAEAGATPRTLQRLLARHGASVSRLIAEARLEVAASLLCVRDGPGLAEIAFLAGFADQAHFARSFRRAVGITPGAYRYEFSR